MENLHKSKKILMVDDDVADLETTGKILRDKYEIFSCKSGTEALEYLYKGYIPDLVLLDVLMPYLDGWNTYKRIRAISFLHDVPVVFFTNAAGNSSNKRTRSSGSSLVIISMAASSVKERISCC